MTQSKPHVAKEGRYSMSEAAYILGVNPKTIYRWRKAGYLTTRTYPHCNRPYLTGYEILKLFQYV